MSPGGETMAARALAYLSEIESNGAWTWVLGLDREEMLDALGEWFLEQEEVAPGTSEHLAVAAAVVLYWTEHRAGLGAKR